MEEILTNTADNADREYAPDTGASDAGEDYAASNENPGGEDLSEREELPAETSVTRTRAFSQRLNEMTRREMDRFISQMGWVNSFTGEPIRSRADYDRYAEMHQAGERGQDPVLTAQVSELKNQLMDYTMREQDMSLREDPENSEAYGELRGEVLEVLDYCKKQGIAGVDLKSAYQSVLAHNFGKIKEKLTQTIEQETLRKVSNNRASSPGALGLSADNRPLSFTDMSDEEFERYEKKALRGELRKG